MSEYLASVAIITYNHEKYIARAIESVLMQKTNFIYEIIIGEDCSPDKTREIIEGYEAKYQGRIRAIYQESNVGPQRNLFEFTFPQTKGKYLAYLEGDDYWIDPYKLQRQVDFLEANPEYGLIYSRARAYLQKNNRFVGYLGARIESLPELLLRDTIPTLTICIRKDLMVQCLGEIRNELKNWKKTDFPIWLHFAYYSKLKFEDTVTAVYRILPSSASHFRSFSVKAAYHFDTYNIATYYYRKFKCNDTDLYEAIIERYMWDLFSYWCELNDHELKDRIENEIKKIRNRKTRKLGLMRLVFRYPALRLVFVCYYRIRNWIKHNIF